MRPKDEPALSELETAGEGMTKLEIWSTTEDLLDWTANFSLIAALGPADENMLPEYVLELKH